MSLDLSDVVSSMNCSHIWAKVMPRITDSTSYRLGNDLLLTSINVIMAKNKILWYLISWPTILSLIGNIHTGNTYHKD